MKRSGLSRTFVAIAMMFIGWLPSLAHDFEVDGIFYKKTSNNTVAVTYKGYSYDSYYNEYIGDVVIPSSLDYNGITYSVTSIGEMAFYPCSSLTSIQIPNSVTSIGYEAFRSCSNLTSIEIPNSVTSIGYYAFYNCSNLTSIEIPNSVTSIGFATFEHCSSLTSIVVDAGNSKYDSRNDCNAIIETASNTLIAGCQTTVIPNSVTSIGNYAFDGCSSLTSIEIPNSVTSIGWSAFSGCTNLTSIEIPNSVTSIGDYAFSECTSLTSIEIPNSVTSIGDCVFWGCSSLTSVEIGNSVTSIGDYAFYHCSSLTSIQIPNSVTSIGKSAFSGCESLTSVEIGNSVTSIGVNVFSDCNSLTSIVVDAGNNIYDSRNDCNAIIETASNTLIAGCQTTVIPNSVTSIGDNAFRSCSSLTSIEIPNSVTSIGNEAFYDCDSLTSVEIPNSVTSIGSHAFSFCSSLTSIQIPNSVTSIGSHAFYDCSRLTSVEIGNSVTIIGDSAFSGCSRLTSVEIGNSVTSIGYYAFTGCSKLTKITCLAITPPTIKLNTFNSYSAELYVPAGCKEAYEATEYWNNFTNIIEIGIGTTFRKEGLNYIIIKEGQEVAVAQYDSNNNNINKYSGDIVIPQNVEFGNVSYNVTSIGEYAFYDCENLTSIQIPNSVTSIGERAFAWCKSLTSIQIPNSVTSIGNYAFSGCSSLTSIEIPNSVTSIGDYAFYSCSNLTSIEIPNSVTSIGNYAFSWCKSLTSIVIPNSVTSIGDYAFERCSSLTSVVIGNSVTSIGDEAFSYCSSLTSIEIPNSVTSIGDEAFSYCSSLTSIEIPNRVTSIGIGAFRGCSSLTSIEIGNSVTSIGEQVFSNCSRLTSIVVDSGNTKYDSRNGCNAIIETASNTLIAGCQNTIIPNSVTSIGNYAFSYCSSLTSIEIPNSVTSIGIGAFRGCSSLTSIEIPNSVTSIEKGAFYECSSLTSVVIGNSVTNIGDYAFYFCKRLTSIVIGNSVTSIGNYAFSGCSSLTSIEIPNSVTSIGDYAFYSCSNLTKITCLATNPPAIVSTTFSNYSAELYVPAGCISAFQSAIYWNNFNIKEIVTLSTSIALNQTTATLKATETITLVATVLPENATNKSVIWKSSNEAVATVDANGKVTAVAVGEVTITVTTADGSNKSATCKVTVTSTLATSITLDYTEYEMVEKSEFQLTATILPESTINKGVVWSSSDMWIASVDANGLVRAYSVGEAIISATTVDGSNLSASCKVTVVSSLAQSITLDKTEVSLKATETATLVATVLPETTSNKGVEWTSSDESVAIVSKKGVITAIAVGEATITATTADGSNLSASCTVTVVSTLAESIALDKTEISLKATETATLIATVLPELTTDKSVEWSSSDETVAVVDENGLVTAVAVGEATITATTADGSNLSATCVVTVVPTPGDVNNDASVNVTDIVTVASYIVGKTTDVFIFEAADMTKDGNINIVDIVAIANIILSDSSASNVLAQRCAPNSSDAIKIEDFAAGKNQSQQVAIEMTNASDYSACQMDIRLPKGMSIAGCELASAATDHMVAYSELPDGAVRVLVYSLTCRALPNSEEGIISLRTTTDNRFEGGEIVVENILFADRGQNEYRLYDSVANVNLATGVSATDMDCVVYAENQSIVIISPCDQQATISSVDGVSRTYTLNEGRNEIAVTQAGIYIVTLADKTSKVMVK